MKNFIICLVLFFTSINVSLSQKNKSSQIPRAYVNIIPSDKYSSDSITFSFRKNQWGEVAGIPNFEINSKVGVPILIQFENNEPFLYGNLSIGKSDYLFSRTIIEPTDSVVFSLQDDVWVVGGNGKIKYEVAQEINKALQGLSKHRTDSIIKLSEKYGDDYVSFRDDSIRNYVKAFKQGNQFRNQQSLLILSVLDRFKKKLSSKVYQLLKTDYIYWLNYDQAKAFSFYNLIAKNKGVEFADSCYVELKHLYDSGTINITNEVEQDILNLSSGYFRYLIEDINIQKKDPKACILYINNKFNGLLKDRLITYYLVRRSVKSEEDVKLISDARKYVKTKYCLALLDTLLQNSSPGNKAYNFALTDSLGNIVKLSDFKGKVVLLDFFFTGCGYCKILNDKMSPIYEMYKNNKDFQFVSISIDKDMRQWKNSLRSLEYTHEGSVDLYTNGEGSNSEIIRHYNIRAYPHIMIIDKIGKILSVKAPEPHDETSRNELLKLINSAL